MNALLLVAAAAGLSAPAFEAPTLPPVPVCEMTLDDVRAESSALGYDLQVVDIRALFPDAAFGISKIVMSHSGGFLMIGMETADGCLQEPLLAAPEW